MAKVKKLHDLLNEWKDQIIRAVHKDFCLDESIVPYYRRYSWMQFIRSKTSAYFWLIQLAFLIKLRSIKLKTWWITRTYWSNTFRHLQLARVAQCIFRYFFSLSITVWTRSTGILYSWSYLKWGGKFDYRSSGPFEIATWNSCNWW